MIWMSLAQTYFEMLLLRLGFGFIFGITIPLGHVLLSEIVPAKIRGTIMTFVATVFIVGKVYCTLLCMLLLEGFEGGHWRILTALNSLPLLLCCLGTYFILRESPRFLMMKNNFQQAFEEIELIAITNNKESGAVLSEQDKRGLMRTQQMLNSGQEPRFREIVQQPFTSRMWIVFVLTSILETSIYILMPFWLHSYAKGFLSMMAMMLSELVANLCVGRIIDSTRFGGRQRLVIIIACVISCVSMAVYLFGEPLLMFGLTSISFLLKMMFTTEMVIMNENY